MCPDCVHSWFASFIENAVLRVSGGKSSKIFPCWGFCLCFWRKVYWSALVPQNLPCRETFLVTRLGFSILSEKEFPFHQGTVFFREDILIHNIVAFRGNFVLYIICSLLGCCQCFQYFHVVVAVICWHERHHDILHGKHSPLIKWCFIFRSFWLCLIVFLPMSYVKDIFLRKAMTGVTLNTFPKVLLTFNICHCLKLEYMFSKMEFYLSILH